MGNQETGILVLPNCLKCCFLEMIPSSELHYRTSPHLSDINVSWTSGRKEDIFRGCGQEMENILIRIHNEIYHNVEAEEKLWGTLQIKNLLLKN